VFSQCGREGGVGDGILKTRTKTKTKMKTGDMVHINSRAAGSTMAASRRCKERLGVEDEATGLTGWSREAQSFSVLEGATSSESWCYVTVSR
jgi:hypothetical protein